MLTISNLSKSYNNKEVLKNISLSLQNGNITSLVGKNGAGKSTLINILSGYIPEDNNNYITKNDISVMPDADSLDIHLTGMEFLTLITKMKKNYSKDLLDNYIKLFNMSDSIDKKIKDYSFGMKKKIAFIQCLLGKNEIYMFDEPTSGVDIESAKLMMSELEKLKVQNKIILLTSHNLDEIEKYSDQVYFLENKAVIKANDKKEKLLYKYKLVLEFLTEIQDIKETRNIFKDLDILDHDKNKLTFGLNNKEEAIKINHMFFSNQYKIVQSRLEEISIEELFYI